MTAGGPPRPRWPRPTRAQRRVLTALTTGARLVAVGNSGDVQPSGLPVDRRTIKCLVALGWITPPAPPLFATPASGVLTQTGHLYLKGQASR